MLPIFMDLFTAATSTPPEAWPKYTKSFCLVFTVIAQELSAIDKKLFQLDFQINSKSQDSKFSVLDAKKFIFLSSDQSTSTEPFSEHLSPMLLSSTIQMLWYFLPRSIIMSQRYTDSKL